MSKRKSATIKANFRMLSAARDQDDAAEVSNDNGYKGGVATYAFLHVIKKPNRPTFGDILRRLAKNFESMNLRQKPILSYSIKDLNPRFEPFFIGTTENKNSSGRGGKNYALLIGIKYTGTVLEKLEGTHEDVFRIKKMLLDEHDFSEGNIQVIVDDSKHTQPTSKNIWKALYDLVNTCKENDCVFFYFAGHGYQVKDEDNDEEDGLDEVLVTIDSANSISDDDLFREFVCGMSEGVTVTCFIDACHSGSFLDLPYQEKP